MSGLPSHASAHRRPMPGTPLMSSAGADETMLSMTPTSSRLTPRRSSPAARTPLSLSASSSPSHLRRSRSSRPSTATGIRNQLSTILSRPLTLTLLSTLTFLILLTLLFSPSSSPSSHSSIFSQSTTLGASASTTASTSLPPPTFVTDLPAFNSTTHITEHFTHLTLHHACAIRPNPVSLHGASSQQTQSFFHPLIFIRTNPCLLNISTSPPRITRNTNQHPSTFASRNPLLPVPYYETALPLPPSIKNAIFVTTTSSTTSINEGRSPNVYRGPNTNPSRGGAGSAGGGATGGTGNNVVSTGAYAFKDAIPYVRGVTLFARLSASPFGGGSNIHDEDESNKQEWRSSLESQAFLMLNRGEHLVDSNSMVIEKVPKFENIFIDRQCSSYGGARTELDDVLLLSRLYVSASRWSQDVFTLLLSTMPMVRTRRKSSKVVGGMAPDVRVLEGECRRENSVVCFEKLVVPKRELNGLHENKFGGLRRKAVVEKIRQAASRLYAVRDDSIWSRADDDEHERDACLHLKHRNALNVVIVAPDDAAPVVLDNVNEVLALMTASKQGAGLLASSVGAGENGDGWVRFDVTVLTRWPSDLRAEYETLSSAHVLIMPEDDMVESHVMFLPRNAVVIKLSTEECNNTSVHKSDSEAGSSTSEFFVAQPMRWLGAEFANSLALRFFPIRCACKRRALSSIASLPMEERMRLSHEMSSGSSSPCSARNPCLISPSQHQLRAVFQLLHDPNMKSERVRDHLTATATSNNNAAANAADSRRANSVADSAQLCRLGFCFITNDGSFSWTPPPTARTRWCANT